VFRATVENVVKNIINIHPARKTNHLICGSDEGIKDAHKPGAPGVSNNFTYVVENNGRGSSHIHALNGARASPRLLADIANYPRLRDRALAAIETHLVASLPLEYHLVGIALRVLRLPARRDVAAAVPTDEAESAHADLCTRMNKHAHKHCETCLKTAKGRTKA